MTPSVQVLLGLVPIAVALVAYRQAVHANRITAEQADRQNRRQAELERTKVDSEAYNRAKQIYEAALDSLEKQLARITDQLAREQDTSAGLRVQVHTLQGQVRELERTVMHLRQRLISAGLNPTPPPAQEGQGHDGD